MTESKTTLSPKEGLNSAGIICPKKLDLLSPKVGSLLYPSMKDGKLLDLTGLSLKLEATKGYSIEDVLKFIAFSELITSESILAKSLSHEKKTRTSCKRSKMLMQKSLRLQIVILVKVRVIKKRFCVFSLYPTYLS